MGESEKISKNELKRRLKAEKKAAEKAEKAQNQPVAANKAPGDDELSPNEYLKIR